jgi:hypothetical protein
VLRDAAASRGTLEEQLGRSVRSFAYRLATTRRARGGRCVRRASPRPARVGNLPTQTEDDRWALPRLQVNGGTAPEQLLEMVRWQPSAAARRWAQAKQHAWRAERRLAGWGPPEAGRVSQMTR